MSDVKNTKQPKAWPKATDGGEGEKLKHGVRLQTLSGLPRLQRRRLRRLWSLRRQGPIHAADHLGQREAS